MQIISVGCPSCGAKVRVRDARDTVLCEYCGTESVVQRRAGVLERPVELPRGAPNLPVATQPHSRGWTLGVLTLVSIVVGVPISLAGYVAFRIQWVGVSQPIVSDVDGDGTADVVGFAQRGRGDPFIAAFDGAEGDELWSTEAVGEHSDAVQGLLALTGDTVLFVSDAGEVRAFDAKTGGPKWEMSALGERVKRVCASEGDKAVLELQDESQRLIDSRSGDATPASDLPCLPAWTDDRGFDLGTEVLEKHSHPDVGGLRAEILARLDGPWVAIGSKRKGSSVPSVAAIAADFPRSRLLEHDPIPALWETPIPAVDPLEADMHATEVTLSGDSIFAAYELDDALPRLTALSLSDGQRRWDVEVDRDAPIEGIVHAQGRVYVALWGTLLAYDASSGEELFRIGQ